MSPPASPTASGSAWPGAAPRASSGGHPTAGRGREGEFGGPPGDLYVLVRVREDERFLREGDDLITALDVPAPAAALGGHFTVPTLDGEEEIEVPAGTQPGEVIVLAGGGMPALRGRGRGDL